MRYLSNAQTIIDPLDGPGTQLAIKCFFYQKNDRQINSYGINSLQKLMRVRMSEISRHTASGQLAGYLFQPERALYHLAVSPRGSMVGIETLDDVAVLFPDGSSIYEQDKHSVKRRSPLAERKTEMWKTFQIWLTAISADEIDLDHSEFHLVTNKTVSSGFCHMVLGCDRKPESIRKLVATLRKTGESVSRSVRTFSKSVLLHSDEELTNFLSRLRVIDSTQGASGEELKKAVAASLPLPNGKENEIIQSLLGWVHDTALALIRQGSPAWLSREAFVNRYLVLISAFQNQRFLNETAAALIPVSPDKRSELQHRLFVKQLMWLGFPSEDEQLVDAIDDFFRSKTERIRLAKMGFAAQVDFEQFEDRLIARWKNFFKKAGSGSEEKDCRERGKDTLFKTLDHRESLAGFETLEYYLTRGSYHQLADEPPLKPRVGWHPKYHDKCSGKGDSSDESNL